MSKSRARTNYRAVKRAIDATVSAFAILLLSPVLVVTALLVRIRLGSPVLFRQERVGLNERVFMLRKFRTMTDARDSQGALLSDADRLTSFGSVLRSTSLDELPELWNVLCGEMSLVGPRPLYVRYLERYSAEQKRRHEVRPGITGLAQVSGRNSVSWDERFRLDVEYVNNLSMRMDMKVIARTIGAVAGREGITEAGQATMTEFQGAQ
jgi:lipopolysaccharide/colanic/teichoic acid biosynthesis glycosyltransferase